MDFPSNSIEPSGPAPKVKRPIPSDDAPEVESPAKGEKIVKKIATRGQVIKKKRTLGTRLREGLASREGQSLSEFIMYDVIGRVEEIITVIQSIERLTSGDTRQFSRRATDYRSPVGSSTRVQYNRYSASPREEPRQMSRRARASHDFGEIELPTRAQAEACLEQLDKLIGRFGSASVAELYEMLDLDREYTDEKWGWTDLRGADVRRTRSGGWTLVLPRTEVV